MGILEAVGKMMEEMRLTDIGPNKLSI